MVFFQNSKLRKPLAMFLLRRLLSGVITLLGATFLAWCGAAIVDATVGVAVNLVPYHVWLGRVLQGDLGQSNMQQVTTILARAIPNTLWLVSGASLIAVFTGVLVGILSALGQYSRFDYLIALIGFVLYSIPPFIIGMFAKAFVGISVNDFVSNSRGVWFLSLRLGFLGVGILGVGVALVAYYLTPSVNRRPLYSALATVVVAVALIWPLQYVFAMPGIGWSWLLGLAVLAILLGLGIGWITNRLLGGDELDLRAAMRTAAVTAFFSFLFIVIDRFMGIWPEFLGLRFVNYRPISTIGTVRPGIPDNFWFQSLNSLTHLFLPMLTLVLVSFAVYLRYTRASFAEVMNQDYVRTARGKGLPERVVVVRHAFPNALLPLATIVPLDLAGLIGGSMLVEHIFAINGMGVVFMNSFQLIPWIGVFVIDFPVFMGYNLVVGTVMVVANFLVDILYAILDPRIRLTD